MITQGFLLPVELLHSYELRVAGCGLRVAGQKMEVMKSYKATY